MKAIISLHFFLLNNKITWGYTSLKKGKQGNSALAIQCKVIPMWFSSISELLERWLISSPEAKKEESRNSEAYGSYITAVKLKIRTCTWQFRCSWGAGPHLLLGGGCRGGGTPVPRALLVCSPFAAAEPWRQGRWISADTTVCEASLQHQMWFHPEEKNPGTFNLFLSLITKTIYSWVHSTRLVMVSWSTCQGQGISGSKSNHSYEFIHCVMVVVKSWS